MYPSVVEFDQKPLPPIGVDDALKNETTFKEFWKTALPALEHYWSPYFCLCTNNLNWYLGQGHGLMQVPKVSSTAGRRPDSKEPQRSLPIVFNHAYDLVEQRVNRLARFKPTFETLPVHLEPQDEQNARLMKIILKQVARRNRFELSLQRSDRVNAIMGSVYAGIEYDQKLGPYIDRTDKKKGREGDVRLYFQDPRNVMPWPTATFESAPALVEIYKVAHKKELEKEYGKAVPQHQSKGMYSISEMSELRTLLPDHGIVYRFIVRPSERLENGAYILCYQDGTIVSQEKEYPYSHEQFPLERLVDIDLPDTQYPFSTFTNIINPQKHHDRILGLVMRNYYMLSHPKVMMPMGACKLSSWANAPLFVEYNGMIKPEVVTFGTSHPEAINLLNWTESQMEKMYGVQGASRGAPPPGTRSGVQLLFFEEQEQQRASIDIIKRNEFIRRIYTKMASEVGDHYPTSSPERLIREVGKNNEMVLRAIQTANLSSELEIEIQNSTAFSESKAVRNQEVLDFLEKKPDLWTNEQIVDILEIGHQEKAYDIKTSALRKAEWENQEVRYGNRLPEPDRSEDLLVHLQSHYIEVQSIAFSRLPEKDQQEMFDHIEITEGLAEELIEDGNELFASEIKTLRQYPMRYKKSPAPGQAASAEMADPTLGATGPQPAGMQGQAMPNEFVTPPPPGGAADFPLPPIE